MRDLNRIVILYLAFWDPSIGKQYLHHILLRLVIIHCWLFELKRFNKLTFWISEFDKVCHSIILNVLAAHGVENAAIISQISFQFAIFYVKEGLLNSKYDASLLSQVIWKLWIFRTKLRRYDPKTPTSGASITVHVDIPHKNRGGATIDCGPFRSNISFEIGQLIAHWCNEQSKSVINGKSRSFGSHQGLKDIVVNDWSTIELLGSLIKF